eukprot:gene45361-12475_t
MDAFDAACAGFRRDDRFTLQRDVASSADEAPVRWDPANTAIDATVSVLFEGDDAPRAFDALQLRAAIYAWPSGTEERPSDGYVMVGKLREELTWRTRPSADTDGLPLALRDCYDWRVPMAGVANDAYVPFPDVLLARKASRWREAGSPRP